MARVVAFLKQHLAPKTAMESPPGSALAGSPRRSDLGLDGDLGIVPTLVSAETLECICHDEESVAVAAE